MCLIIQLALQGVCCHIRGPDRAVCIADIRHYMQVFKVTRRCTLVHGIQLNK